MRNVLLFIVLLFSYCQEAGAQNNRSSFDRLTGKPLSASAAIKSYTAPIHYAYDDSTTISFITLKYL